MLLELSHPQHLKDAHPASSQAIIPHTLGLVINNVFPSLIPTLPFSSFLRVAIKNLLYTITSPSIWRFLAGFGASLLYRCQQQWRWKLPRAEPFLLCSGCSEGIFVAACVDPDWPPWSLCNAVGKLRISLCYESCKAQKSLVQSLFHDSRRIADFHFSGILHLRLSDVFHLFAANLPVSLSASGFSTPTSSAPTPSVAPVFLSSYACKSYLQRLHARDYIRACQVHYELRPFRIAFDASEIRPGLPFLLSEFSKLQGC